MKLKDIGKAREGKIFLITDQEGEHEAEWEIEPTEFELIPEDEGTFFVKAIQVTENGVKECYMSITTPERIAELVIKIDEDKKVMIESIYEQESSIIPAVASECFGNYELYYAKENAQLGIDILRGALPKANNKNIVAEDLGYILRDEYRHEEAIEVFLISEEHGVSSEYIYSELSRLYGMLGMADKELTYSNKYNENGGI